MTEFHDQDLAGARFSHVNLAGAVFTRVELTDARLDYVDLSGSQMRGVGLHRVRIRGGALAHVDISAELLDVVINGVDVAPLVEAELKRRDPERAKMRPTDPAGYREAWEMLERRWSATVQRARTFPEPMLHQGVEDEWSFIQTLRHLNFASAAWVGRMVLGNPSPWHPLDLPWDDAPGWEGIPWDREAKPSLDEVLVVRHERQAMVRGVLESLTAEQLASTVSQDAPGWPQRSDFSLATCLEIVLNEEWEHRRYAERDLTVLGK